MGLAEMERELIAKEKALKLARTTGTHRAPASAKTSNAGWRSPTSNSHSGGGYRPRSSLNLLAARPTTQTNTGSPSQKHWKAAATLAAMGGSPPPEISQKDMQKYYSKEEWDKRTDRSNPCLASDPRNARLFSRDKDKAGRPYCLRCRRSGHTLDACKAKPVDRRTRPASRGKGTGRPQKRQRP